MHGLLLFVIVSTVLCRNFAGTFVIEAEDAIFEHGKINVMSRTTASNKTTLSMKNGDVFHVEFCAVSETNLRVGIRYSNDGFSDTISVALGDNELHRFRTKSLFMRGNGWDMFVNTPPSVSHRVKEGRHKVFVKVMNADDFGIEIDNLELYLENGQSADEFNCRVPCFNDITYFSNRSPRTNINPPKGYILQESSRTKCAEEDNVNIPIYADDIKSVKITATLPKYPAFDNNRSPDFTNCKMVSALWKFGDIHFETLGGILHKPSIKKKNAKRVYGNVATLTAGRHADDMVVRIRFKIEGQSKGVIDSDIGSVLFVKFKYIEVGTHVAVQFKGRNNDWSKSFSKVFHRNKLEQTWDIPDFTWSEENINVVTLDVHSPEKYVAIEIIELRRRHVEQTKIFNMYNDGQYLMEGADIDFWWLINQTMTVHIIDSGETFHNVDYFRLYTRIPWKKDHFSQIFVLYQDGNVRLLPVSPHGLDWIPFGSSVLIGQSNVSSTRPCAPIRRVDISMTELSFHVYYADGGYISFQVSTTFSTTTIDMKDTLFVKDLKHFPFLTFRSMWVTNGNADTDHVSVDGQERHIMSSWRKLEGSSFAFFRRCISKHNTQSPDILVDMS